jgi:hypothetical protein
MPTEDGRTGRRKKGSTKQKILYCVQLLLHFFARDAASGAISSVRYKTTRYLLSERQKIGSRLETLKAAYTAVFGGMIPTFRIDVLVQTAVF